MSAQKQLTKLFTHLIPILLMGMSHTSCVHNNSQSKSHPISKKINYSTHIKPILDRYCVECHGMNATEAGLDLRTLKSILNGGESGPSIIKYKPDESLLLELIEDQIMPPEGASLRKKQIKRLRRWISSGASV
ncbi:MAG: hypothetical protein HN584_11010 [Akkermansiaceae bacterium]|jgi:hypothetical protein|nr:hypothetical protein [Akkermansiaceae bacterium]MDG1854280.1 hypothetical protein [Verrucomicrobiales bacterium]